MQVFDFAIAVEWEYDYDYLRLIERFAHQQGISTYVIWPENLAATLEQLQRKEIDFAFFYDRASDNSADFLVLNQFLQQQKTPMLDTWSALQWAADKALIHRKFIEVDIDVPYTYIIPPAKKVSRISFIEPELYRLGTPFVVKPANTHGGGIGVVRGARTLEDVQEARLTFPDNKYLLQKKIIPREQDGRRFWFRGFYTCGMVQVAWWNDLNCVFNTLTEKDLDAYRLHALYRIVRQAARVCRLNFFSTEIAMDPAGKFIAIDYVNEMCDMRLKSRHYDGVPDQLVENIVRQIVAHAGRRIGKME